MPARVADGLGILLVNVGLYVVVDGVDVPESNTGSTSSAFSHTSVWKVIVLCGLSKSLNENAVREHHHDALKHWLKPLNAALQAECL